MKLTHVCVFIESTRKKATKRLEKLREIDKDNYHEVKSYIQRIDSKHYRVYRKIEYYPK